MKASKYVSELQSGTSAFGTAGLPYKVCQSEDGVTPTPRTFICACTNEQTANRIAEAITIQSAREAAAVNCTGSDPGDDPDYVGA